MLHEGVTSDRDPEGSSFKPDVVLMPLAAACDFYNVKDTRSLNVSDFVGKIPEKIRPKMGPPEAIPLKNVSKKYPPRKNTPKENYPKTAPSYNIGWKDILSTVEVKQGSKGNWPKPGDFTNTIQPIIDHRRWYG